MTIHYIDPSQGSNGTGTLVNPYNSTTEFNALGGDQGGDSWLIKSGTVGQLAIKPTAGISNFVLSYYGTGAQPVLDGCRTKTGTWTVYSGDTYQIAHTHGFDCVFVGGVRLARAASLAAIAADQCWWASNVLYVNLGGANPNAEFVETAFSDVNYTSVLQLDSASNYEIDGIHAYRGNVNGFMSSTTGNVVLIRNCIATYNGNYGSTGGRDGFDIWGSKTVPPTGIVLLDNQSDYNVNCAIELWGLDGAILELNTGNANGNGIELWGYISNSIFRHNVMSWADNTLTGGGGRLDGLWASGSAQGTDTGRNYGNIIEANELHNNKNFGIEINAGGTSAGQTAWKINNNTLFSGTNQPDNTGAACITVVKNGVDATDDITIQFNNNILVKDCGVGTTSRASICKFGATGQAANHAITGDKNHHLLRNPGAFTGKRYFMGTAYNTLALYKTAVAAAGYTFDVNTTEGEPLFTAEAAYDFTLAALSPCKSTGTVHWTAGTPKPKAINGELFASVIPSIGANEIVSAFSPSVITQAPGGGY